MVREMSTFTLNARKPIVGNIEAFRGTDRTNRGLSKLLQQNSSGCIWISIYRTSFELLYSVQSSINRNWWRYDSASIKSIVGNAEAFRVLIELLTVFQLLQWKSSGCIWIAIYRTLFELLYSVQNFIRREWWRYDSASIWFYKRKLVKIL